MKIFQATREISSPLKRTSSTSKNDNYFDWFLFCGSLLSSWIRIPFGSGWQNYKYLFQDTMKDYKAPGEIIRISTEREREHPGLQTRDFILCPIFRPSYIQIQADITKSQKNNNFPSSIMEQISFGVQVPFGSSYPSLAVISIRIQVFDQQNLKNV